MKNADFMRKDFFIFFLCIVIGIFSSSCGLEVVITVQEPSVTQNNPLYSSADPLTWYFAFTTEEREQPDEFIGTEVYYKIYNNYSSLTSQRSSILSVNTSSNSSAAATRMIETYTYQPLGTSVNTNRVVFIPENVNGSSRVNRHVVIRLKSYQDGNDATEDVYQQNACIGISNEYTYSGTAYIPYRVGNSKSFDFFDYDEDDKGGSRDVEPEDGDSDYFYNSSGFSDGYDDTYFVQLFAVAVAVDPNTVSNSYSLVLDLGSVPIRKGE